MDFDFDEAEFSSVMLWSVIVLFTADKSDVRQVMIASYTDSDIRFVILIKSLFSYLAVILIFYWTSIW